MIRLLLQGCHGRMGEGVTEVLRNAEDIEIVAGIDKAEKVHRQPFPVFRRLGDCPVQCDVLLDFSRPDALQSILLYATAKKIKVIIGTTGHSQEQIKELKKASEKIPVLFTPNMSYGINITVELVKKAAEVLGNDHDIEIVERHHNKKVDSPSGTTTWIANQINHVLNDSKQFVYGRKSQGNPRRSEEIGIHSVSGGNICGENQVLFFGEDEVLEITHRVYSRKSYAWGAVRAIRFIVDRPAGLYTMQDLFL